MDTTPPPPPPLPPLPPLNRLPTEILGLIIDRLDPPTLTVCVRINSTWKELCTPRLWSTFNINNGERLERFQTDEALQALSRNVGYIRELSLVYTSICNIFAPFDTSFSHARDTAAYAHQSKGLDCPNLQKLAFSLFEVPEQEDDNDSWGEEDDSQLDMPLDPALEKAVAAFICRHPNLKELDLQRSMTPETLLPLLTVHLPHLEVLYLFPLRPYRQSLVKILLENLPRTIRSIHIGVDLTSSTAAHLTADKIQRDLGAPLLKQHDALESLCIGGAFRAPEDYLMLLPFLDTCTRRLKTFRIHGVQWMHQPQVKAALTRLGVVLEYIGANDFPAGTGAEDPEIGAYLSLTAHWKSIHLRDCSKAGPLAVAAMSDRGTYLKRLNFEGCHQISSKDLCSILEATPNLEVLIVLNHQERMDARDPFVSAADLASLSWASQSLVQFSCRIKVPRPSADDEQEGLTSSSSLSKGSAWEQSRDLQRQVYRKLAEQKRLSHLELGVTYYRRLRASDPQFQRQCLEMTLESGLDELSCLTLLQVLNVSNMDQRIGVAELEWIDRSWPHLRRIAGVLINWVNPMPGVLEWIMDNRRDWAYSGELGRLPPAAT